MKILVVGRGGREHSMLLHLKKSKQVTQLYAAPGNGGMAELATCVDIDEMNIAGLIHFAKEEQIDLTIVGPEDPLNAGISNQFQQENLAVFGPREEAALLEGSKQFAKEFMKRHAIPTADYAIFTNVEEAKQYIETKGAPIVIKADGLAQGKGVVVAETKAIALEAIDSMLVDKTFAEAGATIVIEEFLVGQEFSLMAFVHENKVYPMMAARDHKRAFDEDQGPNTGGMGAYAPVPDVTEEDLAFVNKEVLQKAADNMIAEGRSFTGILYAGLILTDEGPKVIEFNTRFGDPETQVVLPLLKNDLVQVIQDVMSGNDPNLEWKNEACVGVVVASTGYPGAYQTGISLPSVQPANDSFVVQAGTKQTAQGLVSSGGRVLLAGAIGETLIEAADTAYDYLKIYDTHHGFFYRKDIGKKLISQ